MVRRCLCRIVSYNVRQKCKEKDGVNSLNAKAVII